MIATRNIQPGTWQAEFAAICERVMARHEAKSKPAPVPPPAPTRQELLARLEELRSGYDASYEYSDDYSVWASHKAKADGMAAVRQQLAALDAKGAA